MLIFLLMLFSRNVKADLLDLSEVSVEYKSFMSGSVNPLIETTNLGPREVSKELNLNVNLNLLDVGFFDNEVHSYTDQDEQGNAGQFRLVGWNYKLGVHLSNYIDIFYEHFSQHLLDAQWTSFHFPVENSVGIKIFLYKNNKNNNLWDKL